MRRRPWQFNFLTARRRWFSLGLGIKRWLVIMGLGAVVVGAGLSALLFALGQSAWFPPELYRFLTLQFLPLGLRIILPLLLGLGIILLAGFRLGTNLLAPFRRPGEGVADSLYYYSQRNRGPNVVAIGGGTGLPSLLRGLRSHTSNITAIITVADDGGSSGRLRQELGVLPPGDFRNNIAALARDETLMTQLLQYRFGGQLNGNGRSQGSSLQGHAFGNLLLAALVGISGSFDEALLAAERVLAMQGRVLPSTLADINLAADVAVGQEQVVQRVRGESAIPELGGVIQRVLLEPGDIPAFPPAVKAILRADMVVIGPGSLYTSILPNLLVPGIASALRHTKAIRIYVCNLAQQPGETDNYTVSDHVQAVTHHLAGPLGTTRAWADVVLANDNLSVPSGTGGGQTVFVEPQGPLDIPMIEMDLVDEARPWRHDSEKLARAVIGLIR